MKREINNLISLFIIVSLLLSAYQCETRQKCEDQIFQNDGGGLSLKVQEGQYCVLTNNEVWKRKLELILIEGLVMVEITSELHLKYMNLTFGENGELQIFQNFGSPQIIFEEIGTNNCNLTDQTKGYLDISSLPYLIYDTPFIALSGQEIISTDNDQQFIQPNQDLVVVDPNTHLAYETLNVKQVKGQDIYFKKPIEHNYRQIENIKLYEKPIFFTSNRIASSIVFLKQIEKQIKFFQLKKQFSQIINSSCLNVRIKKHLYGVNFINPRGLKFTEGKVSQCLFQELIDISFLTNIDLQQNGETGNQNKKQLILQSNLNLSIFQKLNQYEIFISENKDFQGNLFFGVSNCNFHIGQGNKSSRNKFISSRLTFNFQSSQKQSFQYMLISSSYITINNKNMCDISFEDISITSNYSEIEFKEDLCTLRFNNVVFQDLNLDISNVNLKTSLLLENSYIYYPKMNQFGFRLKSIRENEVPLIISLNNTKVFGKSQNFITNIGNNRDWGNFSIDHRILFHNSEFIFNINDLQMHQQNNFQFDKVFNLTNKEIIFSVQEDQLKVLLKPEQYNMQYYDLMISHDNELFGVNSYSQIKINCHYFQDKFRNPYYQNIKLTQQNNYIVSQNQVIQILPFKIYEIDFIDISDFSAMNPQKMDIQIGLFRPMSAIQDQPYRIIFNVGRQALKSVKVLKYINPSNLIQTSSQNENIYNQIEDIPVTYSKVAFVKNFKLNQFEIQWKYFQEGMVEAYSLSFEYCDIGQSLDGDSCVVKCPNKTQKFICIDECSHGYFFNSSLIEKVCQSCPSGCEQCNQNGECQTCKLGYIKDKHQCIDKCLKGYFYNGAECMACNQDCDRCSSNNSCISYKQLNCGVEGYQIENQCFKCNSPCKTCSYGSDYYCNSCNEGYYLQYGACIKKLD